MFKRFTPSARQVVLIALDEARGHGHAEMGPEHLLLSMLRSGGTAQSALAALGLHEGPARARVRAQLPDGATDPDGGTSEDVSLSAEAVFALAAAVRLADESGAEQVGSGHVLLALAHADGAQAVLHDCAISHAALRAAVDAQPPEHEDGYVPETVNPRGDSRPIPVRMGPELIGDLGSAVADARTLLAIVLRGGQVAAWLAECGIDEAAIRQDFGSLELGFYPPLRAVAPSMPWLAG